MAIGERCSDRGQEVGGEPRLDDIAESARVECSLDEVRVFVDRQENETGRLVRAPELARRFNAVEPRHGNVEDNNVRVEPLRLSEEFASITHSSHYRTFTGQRVGRQRKYRRMIISEQHARALRGARVGGRGKCDHRAPS
jgi:hypothetical protein